MSTQTIVTFNSSSDTGCLKCKFLRGQQKSQFLPKFSDFGEKSNNFEHVKRFCVSQGSAVTFFSGVVDKCKSDDIKCLQDSVYQKLLK